MLDDDENVVTVKLSPLESAIDTKKKKKKKKLRIRADSNRIFIYFWQNMKNIHKQTPTETKSANKVHISDECLRGLKQQNIYPLVTAQIRFECIGICIVFTCANLLMEMMNMRLLHRTEESIN